MQMSPHFTYVWTLKTSKFGIDLTRIPEIRQLSDQMNRQSLIRMEGTIVRPDDFGASRFGPDALWCGIFGHLCRQGRKGMESRTEYGPLSKERRRFEQLLSDRVHAEVRSQVLDTSESHCNSTSLLLRNDDCKKKAMFMIQVFGDLSLSPVNREVMNARLP